MTNHYQIESIALKDAKELAKVISKAFAHGQVEYEGGTDEEFDAYLEYQAMRGAETGLGSVARCSKSQRILGAVLCEDLAYAFASEEFMAAQQTDPMVALIKALNLKYFTDLKVKPHTYMNIKFIGVDPDYAGQGIAKALLNHATAVGKAKGFSYAHTESAGRVSQFMFDNKFDFVELAQIKYADFLHQGKQPIKPTPDHESIKLMVKMLF